MRRLLSVVFALVGMGAATAAADPVSVRAGSIVFTDEPSEFFLAGSDFSVSGSWFQQLLHGTFWADRCPCSPGAIVDFASTTYRVSTDAATVGGGSVNGLAYDPLFFDASLSFEGPSVIAPAYAPGQDMKASGAFTFSGHLTVFTDASRFHPIFSADLRGRGMADVFFGVYREGGEPLLELHDLHYNFHDEAPVPEPSTLLLFGTGLAAALASPRKKRSVPSRHGA